MVELVVTQEAEAFAKSILWVSTLIDDEKAIAQAFQRAMNASAEAEREACANVIESYAINFRKGMYLRIMRIAAALRTDTAKGGE